MMSITPQFTYDNQGNKIGVFLSIEDWNAVYPQLDKDMLVPDWEKRMILEALAEYRENPDAGKTWEELKSELNQEDEAV